MVERKEDIVGLFGNEKFKIFGTYFFENYRTELSVAKETKISRLTILAFRKKFRNYIYREDMPWSPYKIKIDLLADYFTSVLKLNKEERILLLKIISDPAIKNIIFKNNPITDTILAKIILILSSVDILSEREFSKKVPVNNDNYLSNEYDYVYILHLFVNLFAPMNMDVKNIDIKQFAKEAFKLADEKPKYLSSLVEKINSSNISGIYPLGVYNLMSFMFDKVEWVKYKDDAE
jgi:hypothetical protein